MKTLCCGVEPTARAGATICPNCGRVAETTDDLPDLVAWIARTMKEASGHTEREVAFQEILEKLIEWRI
jgi:hypothetical protein